MSYIKFDEVSKFYKVGENKIIANNKITFSIERGEFVVIVGPSGAGKSTVLNILGGMDRLDDGEIFVDGEKISHYTNNQLTKYRRYDIGFVFQFYNLIPNLTVIENVELASQINKNALNPSEVLKQLKLENRMYNFPNQISGGEQQRVAIARALCKNPKILLCDEPTGALDYNTGKRVLKILHENCKKLEKTVIVITHNPAITPMADRIIEINDAKVRNVKINNNPLSIENIEW